MGMMMKVTAHFKRKAPCAAAEVEVEAQSLSDDDLCNEFDKIDGEETGFAPRDDLTAHLEKNVLPHMPSLKGLIDMIVGLDAMVVDKDEFEVFLKEWRSSLKVEVKVEVKAPSVEVEVKAPS